MPLSILRVGLEFAKSQSAGQSHLNSDATIAYEGRPQGVEGTHKGCYRLSSLGVRPWGGHPRGVPLPLGVRPWGGHPTDCLLSAFGPGEGTHEGCPYLSAFGPGEGTHKGCPYRLSSLGVWPWGGHPQGVPLPIVFSRRSALGRAPTRGAPTDCLLSAFGPGEGTHKGCPYRLSSLGVWPWGGHPQGVPLPLGVRPWGGHPQGVPLPLGVWPWGGHPQGVPLPIVFSRRSALGRAPTRGAPTSRRSALGRAPTRGAPTRFRQPHEVYSNLMQLPCPREPCNWRDWRDWRRWT